MLFVSLVLQWGKITPVLIGLWIIEMLLAHSDSSIFLQKLQCVSGLFHTATLCVWDISYSYLETFRTFWNWLE